MRVLDLFAGLGGWSQAFRDRGHHVLTLDNDPRFGCSITVDVMRWNGPPWRPDVVLASPPCETFSTLAFQRGHYRLNGHGAEPVTDAGRLAVALVERTVNLIDRHNPRFAIIENPRALLRTLDVIPWERRTVWYCHLGERVAKPTDLWGRFPPSLVLPAECHNRRPGHPDDCCCHDHNPAPRGSRTGTQGRGGEWDRRWGWGGVRPRGRSRVEAAAVRAKVPYALSLAVCLAAERDL